MLGPVDDMGNMMYLRQDGLAGCKCSNGHWPYH
jgi:hypothetical protein